jgi:hypothetical protein
MLIHPELLKLTTSAGSASGNTQNLMGICYEILVKPTTASTQYDITITDSSSIVIYERTSETGTLAEVDTLPMNGVYTISIANSTANELFTIKIMVREQ